MRHVVALSGGKDSTALALRLAEVESRDYEYLITPTGNELPEMLEHWENLERILGKPLTRVTASLDLIGLIKHFDTLPNFRMRWCTRMLKIEPTIAWIESNSPAIMYVGLRADEETRKGIYSDKITSRFPLREWGWKKQDVLSYLVKRGVKIPKRTDCAFCYHQQLGEWRALWRDHPELYQQAEQLEAEIGNTFRTPGRDNWPTSLCELRGKFANGHKPKKTDDQTTMDFAQYVCRACTL